MSVLAESQGITRARERQINPQINPPPGLSPQELTGAAYAKHLGVSPTSVSNAIKAGWLEEAVRWSTRGSGRVATIANVPLADKIWMARPGAKAPALEAAMARSQDDRKVTQEPAQAPAPQARPRASQTQAGGGDPQDKDPLSSIAEALLQKEAYNAKLAKQKFEKEAGLLVETTKVMEIYGRQIQAAKTKIMALGRLARSRIPHLTVDDEVTIEDLCREALEELAAEAIRGDTPPPPPAES